MKKYRSDKDMRKRIIVMILLISIICTNANILYANNNNGENSYRLEKSGSNLYVKVKYLNNAGSTIEKNIFLIKNVSQILDPINYKEYFDNGVGTAGMDIFPYIEIDGPLEIQSLEDNIYFDTYLYEKVGNHFKGSNTSFYMDGNVNFLIKEDGKNKEIKIKTNEMQNKIKEWNDKKIDYTFLSYDGNGTIYSADGKVNYKNKDNYYSYFLLRGEDIKNNKDLPRVFIKFKNENEKQNGSINFNDIKKTDWYYNYVIKLVTLGGVNGFSDNTFRPNDKIKVGEFLKMSLSTITGKEYVNGGYSVHWAENIYDEAVNLGIITEKDFKRDKAILDSYINREDMAYIIANINEIIQGDGKIETEGLEEKIKDFNDISIDRQEQVLQAYGKKIITGKSIGFDPKGETTRAEATAVIVRILK